MRMSYDGIEFEVLKIEDWTREAVFDDLSASDYLYDHHKITAICMLNEGYTDKLKFPPPENHDKIEQESPSASNALRWNNLSAGGGFDPAPQPQIKVDRPPLTQRSTGSAPTLVELFKRLAIPRRQLIVWMDSDPNIALQDPNYRENVLFSPYPGMETDAIHGPTVTVMNVMGSVGNATVPLRLMIETHLAPCNDPNAPTMISNRWSFMTTYDPDTYAAIHVIEGVARFRLDLLHKAQLSADTFRNQFLHPIPLGFKREQPEVTLSPAGDAVSYKLIDKQQVFNFPGGANYAATKIEVLEEREYMAPFGLQDVEGAISRGINWVRGLF